MKKLVLPLLLLTAAPASAGVVYVPLPGHDTIGDAALEPRILVSNRSNAPHSFTTLFLPQDTDGTAQGEGEATTVAAGLTIELTTAGADRGLAQFESAPELIWAAKLVRPGDAHSLGFYLPVITSENVIAADGSVHLLGWERSAAGRATDLTLVNLGHDESACSIDVFRANGTRIRSRAVVRLAPLSSRLYEDGLAILGETELAGSRAVVSCDQPFFTFALIRDADTGEPSYLGPAGDGRSTLAAPGGGPTECPPDVLCFSRPGVFYEPNPQETIRREVFPIPTGPYSKLHFRVEVYHGGWRSPTGGLHSLFWLALNRHFRLIGFAGFHGPDANDLLFRHGMNLPAGDKPKFIRPFLAVPGTTYVNDFVFDPVGRHLEYRILDLAGNVLLSIVDRPNVNRIHVEEGEDLVADFSSLLGLNASEPPTYGWRYENLTLEVYP
jgi:hypothetical protein